MNKPEKLYDFYRDPQNSFLIAPGQNEEQEHINIFRRWNCSSVKTFIRRDYYRIVLIIGSGLFTYGDSTVEINDPAIFICNKTIPYSWRPTSKEQKGWVCVFSEHFLQFNNQITPQQTFPIFNSDKPPVYYLNEIQLNEMLYLFEKMEKELKSEYVYKYALLQNYLLTLIHNVQKIGNDFSINHNVIDAAHRTTFRFLELLEQQFPIESPNTPLLLKTPKDFSTRLFMHVNSLNHSVKKITGKSSSILISNRLIKEAKKLLLNSTWNITEISYALSFEHPAHFTNYFRKYTKQTPSEYRKLGNSI